MTEKYDVRSSVGAGFQPARPRSASLPQRHGLRWPGHDYAAPGAYFVTLCIHDRKQLLGKVREAEVQLTQSGQIAEAAWSALPDHYAIDLDQFVIMPNHLHGIVCLREGAVDLSEVIRGFKTFSARRINRLYGRAGEPVWQRGFHDRVIRDDRELQAVRAYVADNPANWSQDRENVDDGRAGWKPAPTAKR
jgi:putative transposase